MTKLESLISQLPTVDRLQIEEYAATLVSRHRSAENVNGRPNRINLDELDGLLVRMTDDMSDAEIAKRCLNEWADAAED